MTEARVRTILPGSFDPEQHYYPRVLNAQLHPVVRSLLTLGNERIARRYCHLHPEVDPAAVRAAFDGVPKQFRWGGADLFHVTDERGRRRMIVIETNSSPSGQKSTPFSVDGHEQGGYRLLLERTFLPMLKRRALPAGGLAVLYDKNEMEASGYAACLADLTEQPVWLAPMHDGDPDPVAKVDDRGIVHVRVDGDWEPVRAAVRYVTQRPWARIPPVTRTALMNPIIGCLAGGRNKLIAAHAYDLYNAELAGTGLAIRTPETVRDVALVEVPLHVERMGGIAVVKNPYSNAGQGVWTITHPSELEAFMELDHRYDRFVVQGLVGNAGWSSRTALGRLYHVGTVPDRNHNIYAADLRFMVGASPAGYFPVAVYARRAPEPLAEAVDGNMDSWSMLGTNLSSKLVDGQWTTDTRRLLLMDPRDFNRLGLGLDDLVEAYVQTVLAMGAIDRMATRLITSKGVFRRKLYHALDRDPVLLDEICTLPR